jgi:hypothetical protein
MNPRYLILLALLVCLTGCITPIEMLNPLYNGKDVLFDPNLVGMWGTGDPNDATVRFARSEGDDGYEMVVTTKNSSGEPSVDVFSAHLVSLGGETYLDASPRQITGHAQQYTFRTDPEKKGSKFEPTLERIDEGIYLEVVGPNPGKGSSQELQVTLRTAHIFYKAKISEKSLALSQLEEEWIREAIKKKMLQARHLKARNGDGIAWVLSGPTAELQQFIVHHADDPGAFTSTAALSKVEQKTE